MNQFILNLFYHIIVLVSLDMEIKFTTILYETGG